MAPDYIIKGISQERADQLKKIGFNIEKCVEPEKTSSNLDKPSCLSSIEQVADLNKKDWIVLPREFSKFNYDLAINPHRVSYSPAVDKAGRSMGILLKNNCQSSLGEEFVGDLYPSDAIKLNFLLGNRTPSLKEFNKFLFLLSEGVKGSVSVYTRSGNKLDETYLGKIKDDLIGGCYTSEWLDSYFKKGLYDRVFSVVNHTLDEKGNIKEIIELLDEDTELDWKRNHLSLDSWLEAPTKQGLPKTFTLRENGSLCYYCPSDYQYAYWGARTKTLGTNCVKYSGYNSFGVRSVEQF